MTPQQRSQLLLAAKRLGLSGTLIVGAMSAGASWGFRAYDATNASSSEFRAYRDSVAYRRTLDSLRADFQFQYLTHAQLRTDSAVRKVCAAVNAGC